MTVHPTNGVLRELREALAETLIIVDALLEREPRTTADRELLPHVYTQLGTFQQVVQRARRVLRHYVT
jgi:hypothetical protein